jgi:hypothetical protein
VMEGHSRPALRPEDLTVTSLDRMTDDGDGHGSAEIARAAIVIPAHTGCTTAASVANLVPGTDGMPAEASDRVASARPPLAARVATSGAVPGGSGLGVMIARAAVMALHPGFTLAASAAVPHGHRLALMAAAAGVLLSGPRDLVMIACAVIVMAHSAGRPAVLTAPIGPGDSRPSAVIKLAAPTGPAREGPTVTATGGSGIGYMVAKNGEVRD